MTFGDSMALVNFVFIRLLPWIIVLIIIFTFSGFVGFGLLPIILTSLVLLVSTFFTFTKQKPWLVEEQVAETMAEMEPNFRTSALSKQDQQEKEEEHHDISQVGDNFLVKSLDSISESECINPSYSSDDSEVDWPFRDDNLDPSTPDCSDGSISDEDSLIEIAIPSGHYVGHKIKDDYKCFMQQKKQQAADFPQIFQENNLIDLFGEINDMNEEDNLIEIDILMGSIKCSRFEIET